MKVSVKNIALSAALAGFSLSATAQAVIGSQLQAQLEEMSLLESTMVVVSYDQMDALSSTQVSKLLKLGLTQGVQFKSLPIIGVIATPTQIKKIADLPGVRSVYANRKLKYYNAEARELTGVDKLQSNEFYQRNGTRFTGKGVTVIVNDSGIDATLDDLAYGQKVIENVQGITHAQALSLTPVEGVWIEGQLNSDLNVGHGTHCAGTVAGWGSHSDGKYQGAAPGADLVGYGSGAGLSILDAVGGYDYAISHIWEFNSPIRVMSNSWGTSGKFDPNSPVSLASYKAYKLGMLSVFAAGNDGPGEDSHNPYAQIPWGISVGAGTKQGTLIDFSSRGKRGESGSFTMPDGTNWTYHNEVTIVAPGVDIISTRAKTNIASNGGDADLDAIETEYLPFYTMISGTSMATPHVAGIVATMLEANPNLTPLAIKRLLMETATNMPGYERWEVGAGHVNAYSAVAAALDYEPEQKATVNNLNSFNANAKLIAAGAPEAFEVNYSPAGEPEVYEFTVGQEAAWISASAEPLANTVKLKLEAPDGQVYLGNLTTPVLSGTTRVAAPAQPGVWKLSGYGMTSLSGVDVDPTGLTNGPGLPETLVGEISILNSGGYDGLDDIAGHPAQGAIERAVSERLMDSENGSLFQPDMPLSRIELAKYMVMGAAIRQQRDMLNDTRVEFSDVDAASAAFAESAAATGGALKDRTQVQQPIIKTQGNNFNPTGGVTNYELAYSLVQSLGLEQQALAFDGTLSIDYMGKQVEVRDADAIPDEYKGYVQVALDMSLLGVQFDIEQGPYDLEPTWVAYFNPNKAITRADFAVLIGRTYDLYYK